MRHKRRQLSTIIWLGIVTASGAAYAQSTATDDAATSETTTTAGDAGSIPGEGLPMLLRAPTARLLNAGSVYARVGLDTGGGASGQLRVGLGDVAEFGLGITDLVRAIDLSGEEPRTERIWPYATATFKMGLAEHRLFRHQPALAIGYRKSFERFDSGRTTQFAELHFIASKTLGRRAELHAGGVLWDASIDAQDKAPGVPNKVLRHDLGLSKQLRGVAGVSLAPYEDAAILLELLWAPEFVYRAEDRADSIRLSPMLSWGVRYQATDNVLIESGVRIPDLDDVDLIGAQIFGQVSFVTRRPKRPRSK